ncbi:tol-pal system protein YbgF [Aliiroseovarius sp. PTFE2010]|uniref:tol-pal system protein YbgF n=1 Tax=Aliiroseovarius sp. PTFE2010 TaxID=3417190 RepID=UPI003CF9FE8B
MMRFTVLAMSVALIFPGPVLGQDRAETLADIRQNMAVLFVELQKLKRELSTTGAPNTSFGGASTLERVDLIESELTRLTSKTEELENRINAIVSDGTNKIDDLNFRVCELEDGCDISNLPPLAPIGGQAAPVAAPVPAAPADNGVQLAVGEKTDFDAAKAAFDAGDWQAAAAGFEKFATDYPGGPLTADAHFLRGQSLEQLGQQSAAARAYLTSFSGAPDGNRASEALLNLGVSLSALGQTNEACVTLGQVGVRFPGTDAAGTADAKMADLGCS